MLVHTTEYLYFAVKLLRKLVLVIALNGLSLKRLLLNKGQNFCVCVTRKIFFTLIFTLALKFGMEKGPKIRSRPKAICLFTSKIKPIYFTITITMRHI